MQLKDTGKTRSATVALCIAAVALQIGFAPQIEVMGGRINFMLILACVFILSGDTHRATIAGFFCGIAYDLTASVPVGLMSLILTVTCFISSGMFRGVQIGLNPNAFRCTAIVMFAVNVLYGLLLFFMHVQTDLFWAIIGHGLSSTLLSLLVAVPFFVLVGGALSQGGFSARSRGTRYKGLR